MLVIRRDQVSALEDAQLKQFETSMLVHIRTYFPNHYRIGGESVVRLIIRQGITKAETYGFTSERDVCLYITVMFMLGTHFDDDILYHWAAEILATDRDGKPSVRADRLADAALEYQIRIAGKDNRNMNRAFVSLRRSYPQLRDEPEAGDFTQTAPAWLYSAFPRKYEELGESLVTRMIEHGAEKAKEYGIESPRGLLLYVVMMYFMGTAFDREPFLPWAEAILRDQSIPDEKTRIDRLHQEGAAFLEKWFEKPSN